MGNQSNQGGEANILTKSRDTTYRVDPLQYMVKNTTIYIPIYSNIIFPSILKVVYKDTHMDTCK
jgi:hypothetical protein